MYALLLKRAGLKVERKLNLGGTAVAHEALKNGDLDVYPEYTGTGLLVVLGKTLADVPGLARHAGSRSQPDEPVAEASPEAERPGRAVYQYVKPQYKSSSTRSGSINPDERLAGPGRDPAILGREQGHDHFATRRPGRDGRSDDLCALRLRGAGRRTQGAQAPSTGTSRRPSTASRPGIKYQAFLDGDANVVLAFSTDAEIAINDLVVLEDDKGLWPPYYVAPVVRQEASTPTPTSAPALNALAPVLTTEKMTAMNARVVGDEKAEPATVAKDFLTEQGLIS